MCPNYYKDGKKDSTRRNKFEIWSEILEVCIKVPRTQSWILRELHLKTSSVKGSISFLMERELICQVEEENYNTVAYLTNDKGKEALRNYYTLITKYFKL